MYVPVLPYFASSSNIHGIVLILFDFITPHYILQCLEGIK